MDTDSIQCIALAAGMFSELLFQKMLGANQDDAEIFPAANGGECPLNRHL